MIEQELLVGLDPLLKHISNLYLEGAAGIAFDFALSKKLLSKYLKPLTLDLVKGLDDVSKKQINQIIQSALTDKLSLADTLEKIRSSQVFSEERAQVIWTTESARALERGRCDMATAQNIEMGILIPVNDRRTCGQCRTLTDARMSISKIRSLLPVHPRCRCTFVPDFTSEMPKSISKASDTPTIKDMTTPDLFSESEIKKIREFSTEDGSVCVQLHRLGEESSDIFTDHDCYGVSYEMPSVDFTDMHTHPFDVPFSPGDMISCYYRQYRGGLVVTPGRIYKMTRAEEVSRDRTEQEIGTLHEQMRKQYNQEHVMVKEEVGKETGLPASSMTIARLAHEKLNAKFLEMLGFSFSGIIYRK